MTRLRIVAAIAAILTALLLQATLVAPLVVPFAASLPAVLVAAVALSDGPGSGMAFGFAAGLTADLGTTHPAGVLALCWGGVGLVCGLGAGDGLRRTRVRRDAMVAGCVCALAASGAIVVLGLVGSGGAETRTAVTHLPVVALVDGALALLVIPLSRWLLRAEHLRAPESTQRHLIVDPEPARG